MLLHFDGVDGGTTFTDSSASPRVITRPNGGAVLRTSAAKFGSTGLNIPGTGQWLVAKDVFAKNGAPLATDDFTIEGWLLVPAGPGNYSAVFHYGYGASNQYAGLTLTNSGLFASFAGTAWDIFGATVGPLFDGTSRHWAVVRKGSSLKFFNHGVQQSDTDIGSSSFREVNTGDMVIGGQTTSGNFFGNLDEIRVSKGALYTTNFTPPTSAFAS